MMEKVEIVEAGEYFSVKDGGVMIENSVVYMSNHANTHYFQIGTIPFSELSWFGEHTKKPLSKKIEGVVYLGELKWSAKRMWSPLEEFESMDRDDRDNLLIQLLNNHV